MKLKFILLLLFALLYLSAPCRAQLLPDEPIRFHKDHTENGLIFGTITFPSEKMRFDTYSLQITYLSKDKKLWRRNSSRLKFETMLTSKHFGELNGGKTYLFALEKPPGDYTICSLTLGSTGVFGYGASGDIYITGFSIPFTVNKGVITYIGEIKINENNLESWEVVDLLDEFDRDKIGMKNKSRFVNWDAAVESDLQIDHLTPGTKLEQQN